MIGVYTKSNGVWATGRGNRLLRDLAPTLREKRKEGALSGAVVALSVAFFGVAELNALGMGALATYLSRPPRISSDGSSGGDGSGGDGSGCGGGCGGCGD
jgi:hypothetical protein